MQQDTELDCAVCDRLDALVMRRLQREYVEAIKPIVNAKVAMYSLTMPTIIIHKDGAIEHRYDFTPEQEETLRLADEAIEAVKARIFDA